MFFLVNLFNHSSIGQRSLEDVIGIMGHQLRALGHEIVWEETNANFIARERGYNIIVEGFTPSIVELLARAYKGGARFLVIATEEPSDKGFNQGTQKEMVMRQETFCTATPYVDGILHLVPGEHVTRWYGQYAPSSYAELGYAPTLVRDDPRDKPAFDFGFYGSLTRRRKLLLKRLSSVNGGRPIKVVTNFTSQLDRDAEMRKAKVILQLRKFEEMGLVSSSRCNTALCLGRPVVAEPHLLSDPWDRIVKFTDTWDSFIDSALVIKSAWRFVWKDQFDKFRNTLTPEFCVGNPLQKIGILARRAAA